MVPPLSSSEGCSLSSSSSYLLWCWGGAEEGDNLEPKSLLLPDVTKKLADEGGRRRDGERMKDKCNMDMVGKEEKLFSCDYKCSAGRFFFPFSSLEDSYSSVLYGAVQFIFERSILP